MPVGNPYNGGQSPMEAAAIAARATLLPINTYNNNSPSNEYTATHTRALSDSLTPKHGKGSGGFLDINNYNNVGDDFDINGNSIYAGSGRNSEINLNNSLWGYGPIGLAMTNYQSPNTSLNIGQVVI